MAVWRRLLCVCAFGLLAHVGSAIEEGDPYEEIEQEELYIEAMESIARNPNKEGYKKAASVLKQIAKAGNAKAQYALGTFYLSGQGVRRNRSIATKWFEESARQHHTASMYYLAVAHLSGEGAEQNRDEAKRWFSEIVSPGEKPQIRVEDFRWQRALRSDSSFFLASILMEERIAGNVENRDSEIIELMDRATRSGNANAAMFLALEYAKGELLERDLDLTRHYLDNYHLIVSDLVRKRVDQFFVEGIDEAIMKDFERDAGDMDLALYNGMYAQIYSLSKNWLDQEPIDREVELASIVDILSIAAEGGFVPAQIELGLLFARGDQVAADHAKAFECFSKALKESPRVAAYNQAVMLRRGLGVEKDEGAANALFEKAKVAGLYAASVALEGMVQVEFMDEEELLAFCLKGRDEGDPRALYSYVLRQQYGIGVEPESDQALLYKSYLSAAGRGSVEAMAIVGDTLFLGDGVTKDCSKALEWLEMAEREENGYALFRLGYIYSIGDCVKKDLERSKEYYKRSVDQGNIRSMNNLASAYYENRNSVENVEAAIDLWTRASKQGLAISMRNLGNVYIDGSGVDLDVEEAISQYTNAANLGDLLAVKALVRVYGKGVGIEVDVEEESYWIERSAELGDLNSMSTIAFRFYRAHGVPKSNLKAMMWASRYLGIKRSASSYVSKQTLLLYLMVADLMATPGWNGYDGKGAIKMYREIASIDREEGNYALAKHYQRGSFGDENASRSFKLYMKIEKGLGRGDESYGKCSYEIAMCYRDGVGVRANPKKWIEWLERSADARSPLALYDLAIAYSRGDGVEEDATKSFDLMKKASQLHLAKAHFWLSEYYFENEPESIQSSQALKWLKSLAVKGNAKARSLLRKFGFDWRGEGMPSNEGASPKNEGGDFQFLKAA